MNEALKLAICNHKLQAETIIKNLNNSEYEKGEFYADFVYEIIIKESTDFNQGFSNRMEKTSELVDVGMNECIWTLEDPENERYYETDCEEAFFFSVGGIKENRVKYCPFCGKKIREEK